MLRALVAGENPPDWADAAARDAGIEFVRVGDDQVQDEAVAYVMNSFGRHEPEPVTVDVLARMPKLRIVVYLGQSQEPQDYTSFVDLDAIRSAGVALATTPAGDAVAEAAIGMMIAADLDLVAAATVSSSVINRRGLSGATLGIVGLGQIGRRVAEIGVAMGMKICYTSRHEHPEEVGGNLHAQRRGLDDLCAESDFISVHTSNSAPAGLIGTALERARGAVLINSASAPKLVDPAALLNTLESGNLRRAVVEGRYGEPWQDRLTRLGPHRFVSVPLYSSWDTPAAREAGWNQAIAALSAASDGLVIPNRLV
ncbi:hypothetical protein FOE78_04825 [Microlunatus elymi]|uniref:D-isomer specific 2-hydroxyacid dehydrogenase NAD-binding domain-containing protein n=1 Tax=Microlunatus elymi TaxID=2596828 RepID=A0A516PVW2_9ACTN|nr:NAD(P)-dependent oxidoreductase [Microlunatus elymi]QDP95326.1 hypothetical protein FOE78_04825 [Microlunatus elymi]